MDSNLINPFDGIFWPNTNEHIGLHQLTDILPITTTSGRSEYISRNEIKDENFEIEQRDLIVYNGDLPIFDNFVEEHLIPKGEDVEIVTNNPDDNVNHSDNDNDHHNEYKCDASNDASNENNNNVDLFESYSNFSDTTFRTRTDSSSIADYESHSSDYDDYDDYNHNENKCSDISKKASNVDLVKSDLYFETGPLNSDEFLLDNDFKLSLINDFNFYDGHKLRTVSTNTITSDVFDLVPTDGSTFDLADFIIKDDNIENTANLLTKSNVENKSTNVSSWIDVMSESDSDVTVDIETIETAASDNFEDAPFIDNIITDPSWSPKDAKYENIKMKENHLRTKTIAATQPTKKKLDFLQKKCVRDEKKTLTNTSVKDINVINKVNHDITLENSSIQQTKGKLSVKRKLNIEEYKRRHGVVCNSVTPLFVPKITKKDICVKDSKDDVNTTISVPLKRHSEAVVSIVRTLKEEQESKTKYRAIDPISEARRKVMRMQELKRAQQLKIIDSTVSSKVPRVTKVLPLKDIIKDTKYCSAVDEDIPKADLNSSIYQDFEEIIIVSVSCNTDISLPPLNFLQNPCTNVTAVQCPNKVSRSLLKSSVLLQKVQASENLALSSNSLIASIQNTVVMKTMPSTQHQAYNNNYVKKNTTLNENFTNQQLHSHGENKIIMHLRRDRIRNKTKTMATQTEFLPEFPIFPLPLRRKQYRKRHRTQSRTISSSSESEIEDVEARSDCGRTRYISIPENIPTTSTALHFSTYNTNSVGGGIDTLGGGYSSRSSRRHRSSISSSYSESERISHHRRQRRSSYKHRSQNHSRSSSTSSTSSSHSDFSSREHRARSRSPFHNSNNKTRWNHQRFQNNNDRSFTDRNVAQPAVEERRIVYVGRIEEHTTKEMLKRKFQTYGSISQITTHIKETGMKYGFVTFVRSQDAFAAIDSSSRDPQINMYDVSFGGRRAFCRASYADLDNAGINTYHSFVFPKALPTPTKEEDSFEALLLKVKAKLNANKSTIITTPSITSNIDDTQLNNESCYNKLYKA